MQAEQHRSRHAPSLLAGKRILVCEDEGITVMQLQKALNRAGLQVLTACNGAEGVELALREQPEIVLMDIRMPVSSLHSTGSFSHKSAVIG